MGFMVKGAGSDGRRSPDQALPFASLDTLRGATRDANGVIRLYAS